MGVQRQHATSYQGIVTNNYNGNWGSGTRFGISGTAFPKSLQTHIADGFMLHEPANRHSRNMGACGICLRLFYG